MAPSPSKGCPFCSPPINQLFFVNDLVAGLWDQPPATAGHALLIPRRHVGSWFDTTPEEQSALAQAIDVVRQEILKKYPAEGFTIGIDDGPERDLRIGPVRVCVCWFV